MQWLFDICYEKTLARLKVDPEYLIWLDQAITGTFYIIIATDPWFRLWFDNAVREEMWEDIHALGIYRHRGDPSAVDFTVANFITDGAWHEKDLSAIVPEHAKGVALSVLLAGPSIAQGFWFTRNGQAFGRNAFRGLITVAVATNAFDGVVAVDADRKIQYLFHDVAWTQIDVTVKNWWL